ncbi:MAG TPA: hypothetical protein VME46_03430 [Acidimicrobiales bacterium]|nr:hypothetical protein [Acidimicrobiales bacterium]
MRCCRAVVLWAVSGLVLLSSGLAVAPPAAAMQARPGTAVVGASTAAPAAGRWLTPTTLFSDAQGAALGGLSCQSVQLCVAVGTKGGGLGTGVGFYGARAWSSPQVVDAQGGLNGVSCVAGGPCVAYGKSFSETGATYRFVAGRWGDGPPSAVALASVSCASADFCAGVGFLNYASGFTYNGTAWSAQVPITSEGTAISCPTTTFCAVGSGSGDVLYYQDGTWSKATSVDPGRGFISVSCTSPAFCAAVDGSRALVDLDGHWSVPAKPRSGLLLARSDAHADDGHGTRSRLYLKSFWTWVARQNRVFGTAATVGVPRQGSAQQLASSARPAFASSSRARPLGACSS